MSVNSFYSKLALMIFWRILVEILSQLNLLMKRFLRSLSVIHEVRTSQNLIVILFIRMEFSPSLKRMISKISIILAMSISYNRFVNSSIRWSSSSIVLRLMFSLSSFTALSLGRVSLDISKIVLMQSFILKMDYLVVYRQSSTFKTTD